MNTISVPIPKELEDFIEKYIASGEAENKAQVVRKALRQLAKEEAIRGVLQASKEVKEGKFFTGDLDEILKNFKDND